MARVMSCGLLYLMLFGVACSLGAGKHVGRPFADFDATDPITGKEFKLSDFRGKVVLIDFWATWCGPCVREIPNVKQAWAKYKDDGLVIISISLDDNRSRFESFVKSKGMDWHHVMDGGMWNTRLAKKYGISSIPAMFIIDHEGVCVADSARGARLSTEIERALKAAGTVTASTEPGAAPTPESSAAMLPALIAARDQLAHATGPITSLGDRLNAASQELTPLEAQLPSPGSPAEARDSFVRLRAELQDIRGELFAIGLLNGVAINLPSDPFADASMDQQRAFLQAHEQLPAWHSAIDSMTQARQRTARAFESVRLQLDAAIQSAQKDGPITGDPQVLLDQAQLLTQRWDESWKSQLANVAQRGYAPPGSNAYSARLNDIATRLKTFRAGRPKPPAAGNASASATAESFGSICTDLAAIADELRGAGVPVDDIRLPKNPQHQPGANDRRARAELDLNLKLANEAVTRLTAASATVGADNAAARQYLDQIKQLHEEVQSGGSDARTLRTPRERFEILCSQLLDALDA